ncbi:leucine-rich repeat protein kinase family protein [Wolffia australiana]
MSRPVVLLILLVFGVGVVSAATDPGDAAALRNLRRIWKNTPPSWSASDDPCGAPWDGISCNSMRVIALTMTSTGLVGTLSDDIGQLSELQLLDLSFNINLTGPIPSSIGNLQKLETLSLPGCNFGGVIPPEIGNMQKLTFLALNSNNLSGEIPRSIGRLSNLNWFDIGDNHLSGELPVSSGAAPGLDQMIHTKHFHFNKNQLSGIIPENLFNSNMTLIHILFEGNNFTGPIPASIGLVQTLTVLRLDRNALTGTVPPSIGNMTRVRELHLSSNGLTGGIPDLSGMSSLTYTDLSNNLFTPSPAPTWFSNLRSLSVLIMESAGLIGRVPTGVFRLPLIQELTLKGNKFNGTVDLGAGAGPNLQLVDLRSNIIIGVQNEPKTNATKLMLLDNPVCNAPIGEKDFCKPVEETGVYSTVSECSKECPIGDGNRPRTCECARPYAGMLIFRGPLFRNLRNSTRFQRLETDLQNSLKLGADTVSLMNPFFDDDDYLRVRLQLFPSFDRIFNRSEVQRLGSMLSTQVYKPHDDEWGPYVFRGEIYNFASLESPKLSAATISGIAAASGAVFIGLILLCAYAVRERRKVQRAKKITNPFAEWGGENEEAGSAPQLNGVRFFSFGEMKKCTNNFSADYEIGVGGYGQVYKAKLADGRAVAIKRARQGSIQGALEFKTEIELLSRVHHANLVRLVGFCYEKGEQMLIYEYVANGTLAEGLSGKAGIRLSWIDRLRIALGSARGLTYLHELADPPIIHRDVKTANILLDDHLTPKVADFGLSKLVSDSVKIVNETGVKGTMGYLDPEYFETQQLTDKSDVYSFGVVMLELLTGKKPIEKNKYIVRAVREALKSPGGVKEVIDPAIRSAPVLVGLEKFVDIAMQCVELLSEDRPTMREVVRELESILEKNGLDSRFASVGSAVGEISNVVERRRYNGSMSSGEMSSNAFDSGAAGFMFRTTIEPK